MRKLRMVAILILVVFLAVIYWQKPSDSPVFVSAPGKVKLVRLTTPNRFIGYQLEFLDELNNSFSFKVNGQYDWICVNRCRVSYKEAWIFTMRPKLWKRTFTLISVEQL